MSRRPSPSKENPVVVDDVWRQDPRFPLNPDDFPLLPAGLNLVVCPDRTTRDAVESNLTCRAFAEFSDIPLVQPQPMILLFDGKKWSDDDVSRFLSERGWDLCVVHCLDRESQWYSLSTKSLLMPGRKTIWPKLILGFFTTISLLCLSYVALAYGFKGLLAAAGAIAVILFVVLPLLMWAVGGIEIAARKARRARQTDP